MSGNGSAAAPRNDSELFKGLTPHPDETKRNMGRLVSTAKTSDGEAVVEITPLGGGVLELTFIRATPEHPFKKTLQDFLCYAKNHGFRLVKLTDDALFAQEGCKYSALFYRLFQGKYSLYVDQGFRPTVDIEPAREILLNFSFANAQKLIPLLKDVRGNEAVVDLLAAPSDQPTFRAWMLSIPCEAMRELINKIDQIAHHYQGVPKDNAANDFLKAWRTYRTAHGILVREPVCPPASGGRLRSKKRAASRGKHKCRVTRKSHSHRKSSRRPRASRKRV
jgi:hypothetical protein